MEIQTEITKQEIGFINDIDLRTMLVERLTELDKLVRVNANYSTLFLAISTLEGVLKHIARIFRTDIVRYSDYPRDKKGPRDIDQLSLVTLQKLLRKRGILPNIEDLEHVYNLFRDYRNFIHPLAQRRKDWPIGLGQAQMAVGLLNATIGHLAQYIFIDQEIFQKLAGNPEYDFNRVLHLKLCQAPLNSFLVLNRPVSDALSLEFDLELTKDSIFNFVFNFKDEGNFKFLRLDNRRTERTPNSLLHCTQKRFWSIMLTADPRYPPEQSPLHVEIKIDFPSKVFSFRVEGNSYSFRDAEGNARDFFAELKPNLRIGFFNEWRPVTLSNLSLA